MCLFGEEGSLHFLATAATLSFLVPAGTSEFGIRITGGGGEELVKASLYNPTGRMVWSEEAIGQPRRFIGNGGSAADAQHIAAEFVGRFGPDRTALPAISLSTDTSILTALSNDYGYAQVFARQLAALGQAGDSAIGISTSGNSPSVLVALEMAKSKGLFTIGFTGETGGKMGDCTEVLFRVPSRSTSRIQETHNLLGHILCELIDRHLFHESYTSD